MDRTEGRILKRLVRVCIRVCLEFFYRATVPLFRQLIGCRRNSSDAIPQAGRVGEYSMKALVTSKDVSTGEAPPNVPARAVRPKNTATRQLNSRLYAGEK